MLGPSIMTASAPFAIGYASATARAGVSRWLSGTALVIALLESAVVLFHLIEATLDAVSK
jgi:hypothetical protein